MGLEGAGGRGPATADLAGGDARREARTRARGDKRGGWKRGARRDIESEGRGRMRVPGEERARACGTRAERVAERHDTAVIRTFFYPHMTRTNK